MSGRKKDIIWKYFDKSTTPGKCGAKATCKKCKKQMQGLVTRMRMHYGTCQGSQQEGNIVEVDDESDDATDTEINTTEFDMDATESDYEQPQAEGEAESNRSQLHSSTGT
jgi:BED zinc finger